MPYTTQDYINPNSQLYRDNVNWLRPGETPEQYRARTQTPTTPTPTTPTPTPQTNYELRTRTLAEQNAYNILANVPKGKSEAEIRREQMELAQSQINYINTIFNKKIADAQQQGQVLNQRTRALNIASGLGGSDFATTNAVRTERSNQKVLNQINEEKAAKISAILAGVEDRASKIYQEQQAQTRRNAENALSVISKYRDEAMADYLGLAKASSLSYDEFEKQEPDLAKSFKEQTGLTDWGMKAKWIANQESTMKKIGEDIIGGRKIFWFQKSDGTIINQKLDIPGYSSETDDIIHDSNGNYFKVTYTGKKGALGSTIKSVVPINMMSRDIDKTSGGNNTDYISKLQAVGIPTKVATSKGYLSKSYKDRLYDEGFTATEVNKLWEMILEGKTLDEISQYINDTGSDAGPILATFMQTLQGSLSKKEELELK